MIKNKKNKIVIIQRICAHYNVPLFERLANIDDIDLIVYYGDSRYAKNQRLQNATNIDGFKNKKLFTLYFQFKLRGQLFPIFLNPTILFHLLKDKPDVIICEGESNLPNNLAVVLYAKLTNTPYVWWGLGRVRSNKPSVLRRIFNPLIGYMLRNATAILAYSTFAKEFYSSYGVSKDKIFVAYNCVDTEKVKADIVKYKNLVDTTKKALGLDSKKIILFVGSFTEEKKIENLIEAYDLVKQQEINVSLLLVGDGEIRNELEQLVKEKKLEDVIFVGKKIEDVSLYFLMADVFVLPGEGGLAINQAMIHGLPIITVPADGTELDMVINDKNGYIVESDNIKALAEAIIKVIKDDNLRNKMGQESEVLTEEKFNIETMVNVIISCINFCLNKKIK
jgi:glycosyltransferase involved in cell wall biosynthesis